jgi:hydrogenase maturation protease
VKTLVAGIGNIFEGDDGFGCEVIRALHGAPIPDGVEVVDYGIRGVHLAYQLLDGYDLLVLVDAVARGEPPGSVYLIEVPPLEAAESPAMDAHSMNPQAVLGMVGSLGGRVGKVLVVGCEPVSIEDGIGLSTTVAAAVPRAVELVMQVLQSEKELSTP